MARRSTDDLLDLDEIRGLRIRYSHLYEMSDLDGLMSLFAADIVCELDDEHGGDWHGRDETRAGFEHSMALDGHRQFAAMHVVSNHWIELTGKDERGRDTAEGRSFLLDMNLRTPDLVNPVGLVGVYDDHYVRENGEWLIDRMRIDFLWPTRQYVGGRPGHRVSSGDLSAAD